MSLDLHRLPARLEAALKGLKPNLYVRLSDNPFEDLV